MDTAVFRLDYILLSSAGKEQLIRTETVGGVTLAPYIPYVPQWQVNLVIPEKEEKERQVQGQAFLDFAVGRSVIAPTFRRNPEELEKIAWVVSKIQEDPDVEIKGLYVEGYASPEGSYALNERLSRERAEALAAYMSREFNLSRDLFRVSSVAEDWQGLREAVEGNNLPQKERIYAIIDSDEDYDRKEQRLKALGGPWRTMLAELFPALRRVEYQVDFTVKDYTMEESEAVLRKDPAMLSQRELFLLAQSYPAGSTERDEVFELIYRQYPDDRVALINSAAQMLERGEDTGAKRYLDRTENDPMAANNLGIWYARAGEPEEAAACFERAIATGVTEAVHNLDELRIIVAEKEERAKRTPWTP